MKMTRLVGIASISQPLPYIYKSLFHHPCYLLPLTKSSSSLTMASPRSIKCNLTDNIHTIRRSADYQPNGWNYDFLESLPTHDFKMEKCGEQSEKLIAEIKRTMNGSSMDALSRLELVDAIERLGLKRHFQEEIKSNVEIVYRDDSNKYDEDLYATALRFRVLRQHGHRISEHVFDKFKDRHGNICEAFWEDVRGMLSLYEASFIEGRGDDDLEAIRAFAAQKLRERLIDLPLKRAKEVEKALDLPLHWRFPRLKARWSIDEYDDDQRFQPSLIRLAKLDYNIVQSGYKDEIKLLVRWWKEMELPRKLPYARDRMLEHYLWTVGIIEEPEYRHYREMESKIVNLITVLDDTYDVFGTLEELQIFTHLIEQWKIEGIDQLPEPMKHCYLAIYNTSNEISDATFNEKGFHIITYLSKSWARLCEKYLQEAKWYHDGYKPSLNEYLQHAIVSISAHLMLLDCYLLTTPSISNEAIDYIDNLPNLVHCGGTVIRLSNDLATSSDELARGDTSKALECYMNESGASEEVAREHINSLIRETWKKMNDEYYLLRPRYPTTISEPFLGANLNLARSSQFFYSFRKDWHGKPDEEMMAHIELLLINPVPM